MEPNKITWLILYIPSIHVGLDLLCLIDLLNMSSNLLMQLLHLLGSLLNFKTDLATSGQLDEINGSK